MGNRSELFSLGELKYVICLCKGCDGCCVSVCIVRRGTVGARVWGVSVFRHADVVCLCLVCILCSSQCCVLHDLQFVMLVEDAIGDHTEEAYSRAGLITVL